jgi:pyrroloquinoline quinone biosynthesis protein E
MFLRLVEDVRIRKEPFGGLVYEPSSGTTVELDRGAYRFVELTSGGISLENAHKAIAAEGIEKGLAKNDFVEVALSLCEKRVMERCDSMSDSDQPSEMADPVSWPHGRNLTAPEGVHWAVTYRCNADCPDCYAARHRTGSKAELSTSQAKEAIDRIVSWGAFQLAIGGGEPLLRGDLANLVCHAAGKGLTVHVTTGGDLLSPSQLGSLAGSLTYLQVGVRHHDLLGRLARGQPTRLSRMSDEAGRIGLRIGANLVLCRTVLARFEEAVSRILDAGFRRLVLLRYKPPNSLERWKREAPEGHELLGMEERIADVLAQYPEMEIRLDCALSFLERNLAPEMARKIGMRGCVAGARIVAIGPDGSVYPCSQLVDPRFLAGNIMQHEPEIIWSCSAVLSRMRRFRTVPSFRRSACGACRAAEHCGGCRVFTHEGYGSDPGCRGSLSVSSGVISPRPTCRAFPANPQ